MDNKTASLIVTGLVLTSTFFFTMTILPEDARAATLYVGGGPMPYPTIQSAIENASSGDTIYVYSGTYYENVRVYKTLSLIGQNRDSTTVDGGWIGMTIYVTADWVNITGFTVTNGSTGVNLKSVENSRVANNRIEDNSNGITIGSSENTTISDNIILSNRHGIDHSSSSNTTMTGNQMIGNGIRMWGNWLEHWNTHAIDTSNTVNGKPVYYWKDVVDDTVPMGAGEVILANCTDVTVESQNVSNTDIGILLGFSSESTIANNTASLDYRGIVLRHSNRNTIVDNTASGNRVGIYLWASVNNAVISNTLSSSKEGINVNSESDNNTVDSNIASNNEQHGIHLEWADNVTVISNTVSTNHEGIYVHGSQGSTIINNNASSNRLGIYLHVSDDNAIVDNTVQSNIEHGISLKESSGNTIDNNTISWNNWSGIHLENSSSNTISNSNVSSNNQHGVHLHFSGLNTIIKNRISLNALIGIHLSYSAGNDIVNDIVSLNSEWGVYLHSFSDDNNIYHNDFMNNARQAYDDGFNLWDDGYPSGGNYWSDYTGLDLHSGPDQDIPGSDGIGDEPYVIDGDSQDNYPFTEPTTIPPPSPPNMVSAVLSGTNHQDVAISWDLSSDDGAGLDSVVRYDIHRSAIYDPNEGYVLYDGVPNGVSHYVDVGAGDGDPSNHFYYVCAVNLANNSSCSSNQAGKSTRSLSQGPNLVSIPLIQFNESIEYVLQTVEYDKAWFYDSSSQEWKWRMTSKEYRRGLWNVNHTMALWLNVTGNCNITVAGVVPAQTTIHLRVGWNLVSYPSFNSSYSVSDLKAEIGATRVEGYDLAPPNFLRVLGDADMLQAGYGYWVRVETDVDWTVEVV